MTPQILRDTKKYREPNSPPESSTITRETALFQCFECGARWESEPQPPDTVRCPSCGSVTRIGVKISIRKGQLPPGAREIRPLRVLLLQVEKGDTSPAVLADLHMHYTLSNRADRSRIITKLRGYGREDLVLFVNEEVPK